MRLIAVSLVCAVAAAGCALPLAEDPSKQVVTTKAPPVQKKAPVLSKAQAKRALLTLNDMPTGWAQEQPDKKKDDDDGTVTPKRCQALMDAFDRQDKPVVEAEAAFSADGLLLKESVSAYSTPQVSALNKLANVFRQCPKFTSTEKDGRSITFRVSSLSFPKLGDRTVAVRLKTTTRGVTVVFDLVFIAKGNNGIALMAGGIHPLSGATLEKFARKAVTRLDVVAR